MLVGVVIQVEDMLEELGTLLVAAMLGELMSEVALAFLTPL
jgi:hypothetical protein